MKINIVIISFLLILFSCDKKEDKNINKISKEPKIHNGLFLKGTINLPDKSVVLLQEQLLDKSYKTIKIALVKDNSFQFSELINEEKLYYIGFNTLKSKIPFIANNFETIVAVDINNIENTTITGSSIEQSFQKFSTELANVKNKFVYKTNYIKSNPNSILSAIILKQMLGKTKWRVEQNKKAYNLLTDKIKKTTIGLEINKYILAHELLVAKKTSVAELSLDPEVTNETPVEIVEKKTSVVIAPYRKKAPNFYAESLAGNDISLKSILKNNKVVLIDFWASWCAPCRAESPKVIQLYNKYHNKGFDVIGVSEDKYIDIQKWKNAIELDGLPWHQVIDDNRRVAKMFGVTSIPHTVLLDQNGGIILSKKSTYTIEQKLKEVFGF